MNEGRDVSIPADVFPHDRVVFFSDAVFAIAITLLAIELKPPTEILVAQFGQAVAWAHQIPLFVAFVISFLVSALFWASHMQAWKMVDRVTPGLLWLNICLLYTSPSHDEKGRDIPAFFLPAIHDALTRSVRRHHAVAGRGDEVALHVFHAGGEQRGHRRGIGHATRDAGCLLYTSSVSSICLIIAAASSAEVTSPLTSRMS